MSKFKIGYNNILDSVYSYVFTQGTEDASNPFPNVYDNFIFDFMRLAASPNAYHIDITLDQPRSADYIAFYKTDLSEYAGSIQLFYHNGSTFVSASTNILPADTAPNFKTFASVTSDQWRLVIDNSNNDISIADIRIGSQMTTPYGLHNGFTPPNLAREVDYIDSRSDSGLLVGRSIKSNGFKNTLNIRFVSAEWLRSTWQPFIKHAERYPFYVAWNLNDYPDEIAYCNSSGQIGKPSPTHQNLYSVDMQIEGFVE